MTSTNARQNTISLKLIAQAICICFAIATSGTSQCLGQQSPTRQVSNDSSTEVRLDSPNQNDLQSQIAELPISAHQSDDRDWLIDGSSYDSTVTRKSEANEVILSNGLIERRFRIQPNCACIGFDLIQSNRSMIRGVKPEAEVWLNGKPFHVGGLIGQPNYAYLTEDWINNLTADPSAFQLVDIEFGELVARMEWNRVRHHAPNSQWPPRGKSLQFTYQLPEGAEVDDSLRQVVVRVHYELYDGIPLMSKWITIDNMGTEVVELDRFTSERLAVVEEESWVETRDGVTVPRPSSIHVETDFAFGGFNHPNANRHVVHWRADPEYTTQVNYQRVTPCLLEVSPEVGPAQSIGSGQTWTSCYAFELIHDSTDRQRRSLALKRMYRTIAPWVTENPIMMHLRTSSDDRVKSAIDQCAEVGFEMVILSFGSGFNIEDQSDENRNRWREWAEYANAKGIELGGYSLLSSRRIGDGNDIVSPNGQRPTHGNCPALTSEWGQDYFQNLYEFFDETGFRLLEHDGSYPGDIDVTERLPLQKGELDSRWAQWSIIRDFYHWCREQGIYLNVPDYYYLSGSNKCGMGYREVNWSLPRAMQVIHTRQNIYDGSWAKTPSMGWMFVPLTEYHGGGAAATIEPLDQHLDHYRRMIQSNLAMGVQACYRGPRLYDTDRTKAMIIEQVEWYKQHREILESDMVHGRRADGRDVDWMLHVNPSLTEKGMLVAFNPLEESVTRKLKVNLYYTGLTDTAEIHSPDGTSQIGQLDRHYEIEVEVTIPAGEMSWLIFTSPETQLP